MALEAETETAPPDDIRSVLAAAITEHEPVETPAPKVEAKEAPELPLEDKGEGRERDDTGKFKKKLASDEKLETEAPEKVAAETEPGEGKEKPEADDKNPLSPEFQKDMFKWKAADQAMFKAQSPEAQQFIMRRFKEMTADYTKKVTEVARLKTDYDPVDKIFEPYHDLMKQKGFTPASLIESWTNVEKKLASGEQGALEVIGGLINGYKVPRDKVAAMLGVRAQPQVGQDGKVVQQQQQPQLQLPPEVMQALQMIPQLQQTVSGLTTAQQAAQTAARTAAGDKAMQEIEQFKSAVDDKGTLLHPHFEDLEQEMLDLVETRMKAGKSVPPLSELYETAVWANPSTRELLRTAERQAAEQKQVDQARTKAAAARKAGSSVTGAPGTGQAQSVRHTPERSLRDEIEANAAESAAA